MSPRKLFTWKLKDREIRLGDRTLIVAVLNVTPDSFSDGGRYDDPERAYARALEIEAQGADILDIGAESTKPGSTRISAEEEIRRLIPVLKRLKGVLTIPISVDTYKAGVAALAIEHGAEIINDPSGFTFDPLLAKVVVDASAGLILNHMRGTPETWGGLPPMQDPMGFIVKDLDACVNRARRNGIDRARIVLDPGLGFGKRKEQNSEILARLPELAKLDYPILTGPSRKGFLSQTNENELAFATAAAVAASVFGGAHLVRVHDVLEMRAALAVADDILRALPREGDEPAAKPVGRRVMVSSPEQTEVRPKPTRPPLLAKLAPPPPPPESETELETVEPSEPEEPRIVAEMDADDDDEAISFPAPAEDEVRPAKKEYRPGKFERKEAAAPRKFGGPAKRFGPPMRSGERSYPPRSGPPSDRGDRSYPPRKSGPPSDRGDRPTYPPRSGPPSDRGNRPYPPRSGPPSDRGDQPYPPRRSGPPSDRGDRPYPPRSGPPSDRGDRPYPPRRSGPPSDRGDRPYPPRSGPPSDRGDRPRSSPPPSDRPYPPRPPKGRGDDRPSSNRPTYGDRPPSGDRPFRGKPSGGPRKFGPPGKSGPPRKFGPKRG